MWFLAHDLQPLRGQYFSPLGLDDLGAEIFCELNIGGERFCLLAGSARRPDIDENHVELGIETAGHIPAAPRAT